MPKDGAADRWIREHGTGTTVDAASPEEWTPALARFLDGIAAYRAPSAESFHRRGQAGLLARILDRVRR